jgi:hypothetical protein
VPELVFTVVNMEVRVLQWYQVVFPGKVHLLQLPTVLLGPGYAALLAQLVALLVSLLSNPPGFE